MSELGKFVKLIGDLGECCDFIEGTFRTSAEVSTIRTSLAHPDYDRSRFWTANIAVYEHTPDGSLFYYLGERTAFQAVAGQNIGEFCRQLRNGGNYGLTDDQLRIMGILATQDHAVKVDPSDLNLIESKSEFTYFPISTWNAISLNPSEMRLAQIAYDKGNNFRENMKYLYKRGENTVRIEVLNPAYVRKRVEKGRAIARACSLLGEFQHCNFHADVNNLEDRLEGTRGLVGTLPPKLWFLVRP